MSLDKAIREGVESGLSEGFGKALDGAFSKTIGPAFATRNTAIIIAARLLRAHLAGEKMSNRATKWLAKYAPLLADLGVSEAVGPSDRNHADAAPGIDPDLPVPTPAISVPSGPQTAGADGWEPIEKAPKDGTIFWALEVHPNPQFRARSYEARYETISYLGELLSGEKQRCQNLSANNWAKPTHWRPLPARPLPAIPPDTKIGGEGSSGADIARTGPCPS